MRLPEEIATPALVVDRRQLKANIDGMQERAAAAGARLRPHAKTHKSADIAQLQLAAGAVGLTVATIGEAERFAAAGCDDLFIAYPLWGTAARLQRLQALAERATLRLGVDSSASVERLAPLGGSARSPLVLVEVDSGQHRSGVAPSEAGAVASAAQGAGLAVAGVFTFPGHSYGPGAAGGAARDERLALDAADASLGLVGLGGRERSGGSTPTVAQPLGGEGRAPTELRPGVYVFNDAQQVELGTCRMEQVALVAAATVVSHPAPDQAIVDAGSKVLGADRPAWATGYGRLPDWPEARVVALSEHHATIAFAPGSRRPALGEVVAVMPNHVCTAVNLADELVVVDDGEPVAIWPVTARGANA